MPLLKRDDRLLTAEEKAYARRFVNAAQAALTASLSETPPNYTPPNFVAIFRHNCTARLHGESTALQMKEVYVSSQDLILSEDASAAWAGHAVESAAFDTAYPDHVNGLDQTEGLPLFGFIYREGKCARCGDTAKSPAGRLVLSGERPPTAGRMARD